MSEGPDSALSVVPEDPDVHILDLADYYWGEGEWDGCVTECLRHICFFPDRPYSFYAWYRGGMALRRSGQVGESVLWFRQSLARGAPSWMRPHIYFQLSITEFQLGDYDMSELELFKIASENDSTLLGENASLLQSAVAVKRGRWRYAAQALERSRPLFGDEGDGAQTYGTLADLAEEMSARPRVRNPETAARLSTFFPGTGQVYAGDVMGGIMSMGLVSASGVLLYSAVADKDIFGGILTFSVLFYRFYLGSRQGARREAIERNDARSERYCREYNSTLMMWARKQDHLKTDFLLKDVRSQESGDAQ